MGDAPPWGGGRVGHGPLRTFPSARPASPGPSRPAGEHPIRHVLPRALARRHRSSGRRNPLT